VLLADAGAGAGPDADPDGEADPAGPVDRAADEPEEPGG
jgi:hypothetical protein